MIPIAGRPQRCQAEKYGPLSKRLRGGGRQARFRFHSVAFYVVRFRDAAENKGQGCRSGFLNAYYASIVSFVEIACDLNRCSDFTGDLFGSTLAHNRPQSSFPSQRSQASDKDQDFRAS